MITEIKLENFKGHQSTHLNLDNSRLHALVGKNSSGKTSVLQALSYMIRLTNESFKSIFKNENSPSFIITSGAIGMSVDVHGTLQDISKQPWKISYHLDPKVSMWDTSVIIDKSFIPRLSFDLGETYNDEQSGWEISLKDRQSSNALLLGNSEYFKLESRNLAKAAYSDKISPEVEFNGLGLAPTLDYLRSEEIEKFNKLQKMLQQIVPNLKKIRIQRAKVQINHQRSVSIDGREIAYDENQERIGQEIVLDMNTGDRIPAHAISEGTILALGLLTILMNPNKPKLALLDEPDLHPHQPKLVLLDDIEQGLHPRAQRELIAIFKEIVQTHPNLQIIFTTHSPYIVDELDFSQVHVLDTNSSGFTTCKRLDEHPDVEWAKQTLTTGEFWNAEGEEWVNEEVPEEVVNV
ncbi:MAG: AAA family ATPase [Cyanobacteria bacterium SBLK]|nr:AAA family ATPase [Cyanobacteria bacterium SBLK]